jgi:prepilin-type N-terminal cleavage/methylation domain-containing protein
MHINRAICDSGRAPVAVAAGWPRHAFTLVELMVVIVIIGILASLTLAGLSGVRQRAKIEKTKSTIRKIDAVIQPMYESYLTRRVPASGGNPRDFALSRLQNIRLLMAMEMPDNWDDAIALLPPADRWLLTPGPNRYRQIAQTLSASNSDFRTRYGGAECLFLTLAFGGYDPWAIENFRNDEMGDIDSDGALEFWDGWGRPISFIRWPVGFVSIVQPSPSSALDPFDPQRASTTGGNPPDAALVPLVFSPGPDEALNDPLTGSNGYGLVQGPSVIQPALADRAFLTSLLRNLRPRPGSATDEAAARDNITNHDLLKK